MEEQNSKSDFVNAIRIIKSDKIIILFSFIPVVLGSLIFTIFGRLVFWDFFPWLRNTIDKNVESLSIGPFLSYLLIAVLVIFFFFIINWCFVLLTSVLASPFNDLISERVEKKLTNQELKGMGESLKDVLKNLTKVIFNEIKKVVLIIFFTMMAYLFSIIPFLIPVSLILSALLMSASFLDYSWSRHLFSPGDCLKDLKKGILGYTIGGGVFIFLMGLPIINLVFLPLGVVYFTYKFVRLNNNGKSGQKSPR